MAPPEEVGPRGTSRLGRAVAPDGVAGLALAIGSFLIGAFLPMALDEVSRGWATTFAAVGVLLVVGTLLGRLRGGARVGDCIVLTLPTDRWRASERVASAISDVESQFERYWLVPQVLPKSPQEWPTALEPVLGWCHLTLRQRSRLKTDASLSILPFMPEPVAWLIGARLGSVDVSLLQEHSDHGKVFRAIELRGRLTVADGATDDLVTHQIVALDGRGSSRPEHFIVIDIGRRRGFRAAAIRSASVLGCSSGLVVSLPTGVQRIEETQHTFSAVVENITTIVSDFVEPLGPAEVFVYVNAPVSISMALGNTLEAPCSLSLMQRTGTEFVESFRLEMLS